MGKPVIQSMSIPPSKLPLVLIAEDEDVILSGIVGEMQAAGFSVIAAHDTQDALAKFEDHPEIAAVFADVHMPGPLDGVSLANIVSRLRPEVRLILTSGRGPLPRKPPAGAHFLPKPYDCAALAELINPPAAGV